MTFAARTDPCDPACCFPPCCRRGGRHVSPGGSIPGSSLPSFNCAASELKPACLRAASGALALGAMNRGSLALVAGCCLILAACVIHLRCPGRVWLLGGFSGPEPQPTPRDGEHRWWCSRHAAESRSMLRCPIAASPFPRPSASLPPPLRPGPAMSPGLQTRCGRRAMPSTCRRLRLLTWLTTWACRLAGVACNTAHSAHPPLPLHMLQAGCAARK